MKRLFVGKLSFSTTADHLRALFAEFGPVGNVTVECDDYTGRSLGFGFVEIEDNHRALEAITALHGTAFDGSTLVVEEARQNTGESRGEGDYQDGSGDPRRKRRGQFR